MKKRKSNYHKDTKSHNVNIRVVSGLKNKKINVENFNKNEMIARLFVIQRNWNNQDENITLNKDNADIYIEKIVKENFIYPINKLQTIKNNLLLFLLGNKNNIFSKSLNI
jgi:hypothetical protein